MKFYIRNHKYLTKHVQAWKVYDKMPDNMPEVFKKSKLICYDSVELECSMSGSAEVKVNNHSMTDSEGLKKDLLGCVEISEEKFNDLYNRCTNLKNDIKQAIEDEDSI